MTDTAFNRQFKRAAVPGLIRQFGEVVTYYPRDGSSGRQIRALVERDLPELVPGLGEITGQSIMVRVTNSSNTGISSDEVDTGGDEISVPLRVGQSAERRRVAQVVSDSGGMVRLLCN